MSGETIATTMYQGEELHFVLLDHTDEMCEPGAPVCEVMVYRCHLSPEREHVFSQEFLSIAEAKEFFRKEYGVPPDDWGLPPTFAKEFAFEYQVTNVGCAQPHPIGFDDAKIIFRLSTCDDRDGGRGPSQELDICGTKEGLRQLAAICLLCADSAQYDEFFHAHLEGHENVSSNIGVTIRAPSYFAGMSKKQSSETSGTMVDVPKDPSDERPKKR